MKTFLLLSIIFFMLGLYSFSQSPQSFRYQAIARIANGNILTNQIVSFKISILQGGTSGTVLYTETHPATTNAFGLVNLSIGSGTVITGTFSTIDWSAGSCFIKIELDATGGSTYYEMGTAQLLSVPYALYAASGNQGPQGLQGQQGVQGIQGAQGPVGQNGQDGIGISSSYVLNDSLHILLSNGNTLNAGHVTGQQGLQGLQGPQGQQGQQGSAGTYTAGLGIDLTNNTISNTLPDQTITLQGTGTTNVTGIYPNFTIHSTDTNTTYLAGNGLSLNGTTFNSTWSTSGYNIFNNNAGNVGIGTNNPIASLDISGSIHYDDGSTFSLGNVLTSDANGFITWHAPAINLSNGTTNYLSKFTSNNSLGNSLIYENGSNLGIGTTTPSGRFMIQQDANAADNEPIFEVKDKSGQTVMVLYKDSTHFFVKDPGTNKTVNRGSFAVSGKSSAKSFTNNYLFINPDSTRIYTSDSTKGFGVKNIGSSGKTSYMQMNPVNYFIGHEAGNALNVNPTYTGKYNSFIGYQSGFKNTTGIKNYFIGYRSGYNNSDGFSNIFIGDSAGFSNTSGYGNVFQGNQSGFSNYTGNYNVCLGFNSGYKNNADYNVFLGYEAGKNNTSGTWNVFTGYQAGYSNQTGYSNIANGYQALLSNVSGNQNVANGNGALYENITGDFNVACGNYALYHNTSGQQNVAIGMNTLWDNNSGMYNIAIGNAALYNNKGMSNVSIGAYTMFNNTLGEGNTANGHSALFNNILGNYNTASGNQALYSNTTGNYNTAVGINTLLNNTSGDNNTALGKNAFISGDTYSNSTALGANALIDQSNKVRIGDANVIVIEGQVAWSFPSDGRFKYNVKEDVKGLEFITKLHPITYQFNTKIFDEFLMQNYPDSLRRKLIKNKNYSESSAIVHTGFIAQEIEKAAKESGFVFDGVNIPKNGKENYSVAYSQFTVPLVKAVQELNAKNEALTIENEILKIKVQEIDLLKTEIENIKSAIGILKK